MTETRIKSDPTSGGTTLMAVLLSVLAVLAFAAGVGFYWHQRQQPRVDSLHIAAVHFPDDVPKIIARGADVNERFPDGATPLWMAVASHKRDSVQRLLDVGADPNRPGADDETPLLKATFMCRYPEETRIALLLLEHGADPNVHSKVHDETPLHRAIRSGNVTVARALLDRGADPDARRIYEETPLHVAASQGETAIVEALLAAGAEIDALDHHENTPLQRAVAAHEHAVIETLLRAGASTTLKNKYGMLPIDQHQGDEQTKALFKRHAAEQNTTVEQEQRNDA